MVTREIPFIVVSFFSEYAITQLVSFATPASWANSTQAAESQSNA
jgi:hypothetical protein